MTHLTATDHARLETALRDEGRRLLEAIRSQLQHDEDRNWSSLADSVHDLGDEAVADVLADAAAAQLDREVTAYRAVEAALGRMRDGSYGRCRDCGHLIARARLTAAPAAARCVACETRREIGAGTPPSL